MKKKVLKKINKVASAGHISFVHFFQIEVENTVLN